MYFEIIRRIEQLYRYSNNIKYIKYFQWELFNNKNQRIATSKSFKTKKAVQKSIANVAFESCTAPVIDKTLKVKKNETSKSTNK